MALQLPDGSYTKTIMPEGPAPSEPYVDSPFLTVQSADGKTQRIPNLEWGKRNGWVWNGTEWVRADQVEGPSPGVNRPLPGRRPSNLAPVAAGGPPKLPPNAPPEDAIRALIEAGRTQVAQGSEISKAAEQLVAEAEGQAVLESGRPWKWNGKTYEYTDTPEAAAKQEQSQASQITQGQDAYAKMIESRRRMNQYWDAPDPSRPRRSGQAQPLPPRGSMTRDL